MFKSIEYIKFLKKENNVYYDLYKIIDDDFEGEYIGATGPPRAGGAAAAIINCYSSRNLNVAKNLILFMQNYQEKYNYYITDQIYWYKKYIPGFEQYLPEIEKYLSLI
jgi:hypothetical protein